MIPGACFTEIQILTNPYKYKYKYKYKHFSVSRKTKFTNTNTKPDLQIQTIYKWFCFTDLQTIYKILQICRFFYKGRTLCIICFDSNLLCVLQWKRLQVTRKVTRRIIRKLILESALTIVLEPTYFWTIQPHFMSGSDSTEPVWKTYYNQSDPTWSTPLIAAMRCRHKSSCLSV